MQNDRRTLTRSDGKSPPRKGRRLGGALPLLILPLFVVFASARAAPSLTRVSTERPGWSLGFGLLSYGLPYKDVTRWTRFVPLVNAQGDGFYVHGLNAGYWFYRRHEFRVSVVLAPELLHISSRFGPFARSLHDRQATLLGGLRASFVRPLYAVHLSALTDLLARSKGQVLRLSAGPRWHGVGWRLSARMGVDWESANQITYYFGVPADQSSVSLPSYDPGSAVNTDATLVIARKFWALGAHFEAVGSVEEIWYGASVRESPLVARSTALSGLIGLMFRFR